MTHARLFQIILLLGIALPVILRATPLTFEAEQPNLGRTTSGPPTATVSDARARDAAWVSFDGPATGDWLQFTLPSLLPGRYRVELTYRTHEHMGKWRIEVGEADGTGRRELHAGFDCNESPEGAARVSHPPLEHHREGFRRTVVGIVAFDRPGYRTLRFTRLDRAGGGTQLGVDAITFIPDFTATPAPPEKFRISAAGPVHAVLAWDAPAELPTCYLIERLGAPTETWQVAGYAPGHATEFTSTGLHPQSVYRHRVRSFRAEGLGEPSPEVTLTTQSAPAAPRGTVIDTAGSRLGEGSVVQLGNGRLLMIVNFQETVNDFAAFSLRRKESTDGGRTWSAAEPFLQDPTGRTGYMMPSLLRLRDGSLGFSYAVREQKDLRAHRVFRTSRDEGRTWSEPVIITTDLPLAHEGRIYTGATGPHDRLIETAGGDLLLPFHLTTGRGDTDTDPFHDRLPPVLVSATVVYKSSDLGATWRRVFGPVLLKGTSQRTPYRYHWFDQVLSEPSLVEYAPGRLLLMMRNQSGFIQQARSLDGGETWTPVHQSPVPAPLAPPKLLKIGPATIALIFNPWVDFSAGNLGPRFALGTMVSDDGGLTWRNFKALDLADPAQGSWQFAYPFFLRTGNGWEAFYFGPRGFDLLQHTLPANWFE